VPDDGTIKMPIRKILKLLFIPRGKICNEIKDNLESNNKNLILVLQHNKCKGRGKNFYNYNHYCQI